MWISFLHDYWIYNRNSYTSENKCTYCSVVHTILLLWHDENLIALHWKRLIFFRVEVTHGISLMTMKGIVTLVQFWIGLNTTASSWMNNQCLRILEPKFINPFCKNHRPFQIQKSTIPHTTSSHNSMTLVDLYFPFLIL